MLGNAWHRRIVERWAVMGFAQGLLVLVLTLPTALAAGTSPAPPTLDDLEPVRPGGVSTRNRALLAPHIARIAARHRVEPELVEALIAVESGFDPRAVSPRGAIGLMQLLPDTAQAYGVEDPLDPIANITAGTQHLRRLLGRYRNISHALAAYNAGEGAMDGASRQVTYLETRKFVIRVIRLYQNYRGL
jgi:soluble lytic murein transglycosylase-like protein